MTTTTTDERHCGTCQLCRKLIPKLVKRNCRWLTDPATAELPRPDQSHYVIDVVPGSLSLRDKKTRKKTNIQAVQILVDPEFPEPDLDDTGLQQYFKRLIEDGIAAIVHYSSPDPDWKGNTLAQFKRRTITFYDSTRWKIEPRDLTAAYDLGIGHRNRRRRR